MAVGGYRMAAVFDKGLANVEMRRGFLSEHEIGCAFIAALADIAGNDRQV